MIYLLEEDKEYIVTCILITENFKPSLLSNGPIVSEMNNF